METPAVDTSHHTTKEPIFPVHTPADAAYQILADPACKRPGCHGRGYIGIQVQKDGTTQILLCRCASYGETDSVRLVQRMNEHVLKIAEGVDLQYGQIMRTLGNMENHRRVSEDLNYEHMKRIESVTVVGALRGLWASLKRRTNFTPSPRIEPSAIAQELQLEGQANQTS